MSAPSAPQFAETSTASSPTQRSSGPWIVNAWMDQVLIVSTPVIIALTVAFIRSPVIGLQVETIALIVGAFGAMGHHLPGMIRAYGDPELFQRFRLRFILAPIFLFAVFFPLFREHRGALTLISLVWAYWHGLMQVYGFVRIYDVKVGSTSSVTAYWDWLMCVFWFMAAQFFSPEKISRHLEYWYDLGGPMIPPALINSLRWIVLSASVFVLIGFLANHVIQTYRGQPPNPIKFLMLASGIGCWWFAIVFIKNILLGIAIFEVVHDIQYLAIVWLYNCRRVNMSPDIGKFMKFVFRRGMLILYLGLVFAYGALGLVQEFSDEGTVKTVFTGILWTSTILHFYYDGFIWKVREKSTRSSLGLNEAANSSRTPTMRSNEWIHLLKWSPLFALIGMLLISDLLGSTMSQSRRRQLDQKYALQLSGSTELPQNVDERSWLYTHFQQVQNIAAASPNDSKAQLRSAVMLANFGRNDEAVTVLQKLIDDHPTFAESYIALGDIEHYRGNIEQAVSKYEMGLSLATTSLVRGNANFKLGEVYLHKKQFELANDRFQQAMKEDPKLEPTIKSVLKSNGSSS